MLCYNVNNNNSNATSCKRKPLAMVKLSVREAEERHSPATSRSPRRGRRRERTPAWPTTRNGEKGRRSPSRNLLNVVSIVDNHYSCPSEHRTRGLTSHSSLTFNLHKPHREKVNGKDAISSLLFGTYCLYASHRSLTGIATISLLL